MCLANLFGAETYVQHVAGTDDHVRHRQDKNQAQDRIIMQIRARVAAHAAMFSCDHVDQVERVGAVGRIDGLQLSQRACARGSITR